MSLFYLSDQYHQSKQIIYSSIPNFLIDLAKIINDYFIVELRVGTKLDCKDPYGMWYIAQVMQLGEDENGQRRFFIHYCGWGTLHDDWIEMHSVYWRFDLLNTHTPVHEDSIISEDFSRQYGGDFYRVCPTVAQRKILVGRISKMGFAAEVVQQTYEQFQWNKSPCGIFQTLCSKFPTAFRCSCAPRKPICVFCNYGDATCCAS